jgi:outer membrane biosynthesis protein TonB
MASFVRRLFGKPKSQPAPPPAPPPPAPKPKPQPAESAKTEAQGAQSGAPRQGGTKKPGKRSQTTYTGALGLSVQQRSGINLKTLVGQ